MSNTGQTKGFEVGVECRYLEDQSNTDESQYVFAYTVTITNNGEQGAQLMRRHWVITDANGKEQEVKGDGVIGEQPYIDSGETYQYTSGAILKTPLGTMHGTYQMVGDDGQEFNAIIPLFSLTKPGVLN